MLQEEYRIQLQGEMQEDNQVHRLQGQIQEDYSHRLHQLQGQIQADNLLDCGWMLVEEEMGTY